MPEQSPKKTANKTAKKTTTKTPKKKLIAAPPELVLKLASEGGSLTMSRLQTQDGKWHYLSINNEVFFADLLRQGEFEPEAFYHKSRTYSSFNECFAETFDIYPSWPKRSLLYCHPSFRERVRGKAVRYFLQQIREGQKDRYILDKFCAWYTRHPDRDERWNSHWSV